MKKKRLLLSVLSIIVTTALMAQSLGTVKIRLVDDKDSKGMVGAIVVLTPDGERLLYNTTKSEGDVSFPSIDYGKYELTATFMGYDTIRRSVVLDREVLDLGDMRMKFRSKVIDRVTVQTNSIRTSQSGDTVIYNAESFKVSADAAAEGLLAKMPGITVDEEGEVEAQGEEVKKIYLDGKEFFGEDVALAVKNIPADIIAKVEIFNKLSDSAEFTGFDDGEGYKAINIVTKTGMNRGHFGKFVAGGAYEDLYQLSANYNYFTSNHRLSVIGSANNMNIKGFSSMNVGGGGSGRAMTGGGGSFMGSTSAGLSTLAGIGVNYGGSFLKDKMKVEASYFYNMSENEVDKTTDRQYVTDNTDIQRYYDAVSESETDNMNHRVNARMEYKPNNRHMLMIRPEFAFQDNSTYNYSFAENSESESGSEVSPLTDVENLRTSDKNAFNVSNMLVYRALLGMKGRNVMLTARVSYSQNDNDDISSNTTYTYSSMEEVLTKQNITNNTESYTINSSVTYSEPIFDKSAMLNMKYMANYNYSDADYLVYEWEQYENMFNPNYDETSSNIYNSGYLTQSVGPGIMYSKPNSLMLNAGVYYQYATLDNMQDKPIITPAEQRYDFNNIVYNMMMRKTIDRNNSLRVMLRSYTTNPSVSNLQEVVKDSDPSNVSSGNSDLEPSYNHSLRATYVRSSIRKGRTFMAMLNGGYATNSIVDNTVMLLTSDDTFTLPNGEQLEQYGEYTSPVNMDGKWNAGASVSYGTPINLLYSNLNLSAGVNYSESPSILNDERNLNRTTNYKAGASLGSNISENADFTLSYSGGYNTTKYENDVEGAESHDNNYLTQSASLKFKFVFWCGITLTSTTTYSQYKGVTDSFNEQYVISDLYLGKKIFKNNRGEITVGVNDIFDQMESFSRNVTESYVENVLSNSLGRYYGVKLTFDLRKFNGQISQMMSSGRPQRGEGGMGGPPDGGMGGGGPRGGGMF